MNERIAYSYLTLKYIHDAVTGEFVNVGVVMFAPEKGFVGVKMRRKYGRINSFFPDAQGAALTKTLRGIERAFKRYSSDMKAPGLFDGRFENILSLVRSTIPLDDSALQWGDVRGGMAKELASALDRHFERLVSHYDEAVERESRSDNEIWKEFSRVLVDRRLEQKVTSHAIRAPLDVVQFDKALKNGKWHVLEPVSFDLMDGATIKRKAHQIIGQMSVLEDAKEDFDIYLLIGEPRNPGVVKDYKKALKMLEAIKVPTKVFTESNASDFGKAIEVAMQG